MAFAQKAEAAGLDAVYGIEALGDPFVPLAAMACATSTLRLGTYVVSAYARTPQAAATAALNLDNLTSGRFLLGIGTGNRHINDWFLGVDSNKPLQKMHEYLDVVRALLRGPDPDRPDVGGSIHHMQARWVSQPARKVPFVLAAAGPRMIELAAAKSDGVGLGILVSTDHLMNEIRPRAQAAAAAAGADPSALRFLMSGMLSVHDDAAVARANTRRAICGLFHPVPHPYYDFLLRAQGYANVAEAAAELVPQGLIDEAMETIDDDLIDRLTITGTPAQCAARLHDYDGLVDEIICLNFGAGLGEDLDEHSEALLFEVFSLARKLSKTTI